MDHSTIEHRSAFAWLLVWRALLAAVALYTALEKPFGTMVTTLVVLALLLFAGETVYKSKLYFERERRRKQRDEELRAQRAAEAALRREAAAKARQASRRSFMDLDDDEPAAVAPSETAGGINQMSARDFDTALR